MGCDIVAAINSNQVTVIAGDTGCGKTTQVPQLVLDDLILRDRGSDANIIVTQPRRISAISVAERIAVERLERIGETVGYNIKLEKRVSRKTRLLLCTTGILLRRLQCDPDLASVSHVFLDEVHERDINSDFLLIILKELLRRRKSLKLVLMSATLNAESFASYFDGSAVVTIPGRTHPVQELRLEDVFQQIGYKLEEGSDYALKATAARRWTKSALRKRYAFPKYDKNTIQSLSVVDEKLINYELIAKLVKHICLSGGEGAILVFLPGLAEISKAIDEIHKIEMFQSDAYLILPLHSTLSSLEQAAVFDVPKDGVRKIVLATNIAETSITIEGK
jgi:HrpA-like RNA helicase